MEIAHLLIFVRPCDCDLRPHRHSLTAYQRGYVGAHRFSVSASGVNVGTPSPSFIGLVSQKAVVNVNFIKRCSLEMAWKSLLKKHPTDQHTSEKSTYNFFHSNYNHRCLIVKTLYSLPSKNNLKHACISSIFSTKHWRKQFWFSWNIFTCFKSTSKQERTKKFGLLLWICVYKFI